jgi:hypothetical protein
MILETQLLHEDTESGGRPLGLREVVDEIYDRWPSWNADAERDAVVTQDYKEYIFTMKRRIRECLERNLPGIEANGQKTR